MTFAEIFDPTKELDALAPAKEKVVYAAPVSHRVVDRKRFVDGSIIGHNIHLCSHCHKRVDFGGVRFLYCCECGYRLEDPKDD